MWRTDIEKECFIHYNSLDSLGLRKYLTGINTNDPVSDIDITCYVQRDINLILFKDCVCGRLQKKNKTGFRILARLSQAFLINICPLFVVVDVI